MFLVYFDLNPFVQIAQINRPTGNANREPDPMATITGIAETQLNFILYTK